MQFRDPLIFCGLHSAPLPSKFNDSVKKVRAIEPLKKLKYKPTISGLIRLLIVYYPCTTHQWQPMTTISLLFLLRQPSGVTTVQPSRRIGNNHRLIEQMEAVCPLYMEEMD